ncbi:hypothetical protein BJX63DRAFT_431636 [Aspergillus granulosus]|uniref:Uncharacterized protein n=1 Tax=Aspergillus granulosus TaxID=176169 RepID=A0ABR4HF14_9EURO
MKLAPLLFLSCIFSNVAGFHIRGAAERAWYFTIYLQEEIYENPDDRQIATGCVGSRDGLRGQANRCTLHHSKMIWEKVANQLGRLTAYQATAAIKGVKINRPMINPKTNKPMKDKNGNIKTRNAVTAAYTGKVHGANLLPKAGIDMTDDKEYYRMVKVVGDAGAKVQHEVNLQLESSDSKLDDNQKAQFERWKAQGLWAIEQVVGMRQAKIQENIIEEMKKPIYFGHDPVTDPNNEWRDKEFFNVGHSGVFDEVSTEKTFKKYEGLFGGLDQVKTAWKDAFAQLSATNQAKAHLATYEAFVYSHNTMKKC